MKPKNVLLALALTIILFSNASAFTLKTTAGFQTLASDALYNDVPRDDTAFQKGEVFAKAGTNLYTLDPRHKANGTALLASKPSIEFDGPFLGKEGKIIFELAYVEPTTYLRGTQNQLKSRCSDRCAGPKVSIGIKNEKGFSLNNLSAASNFIMAGKEMDLGTYKYKITKIVVPEYKETFLKVNGKEETWYLVLGQTGVMSGMMDLTPKDIVVEFCVSKFDGARWGDCIYSLAGATTGETPVTGPSTSTVGERAVSPGLPQAQQIAEGIRETTVDTATKTDATVYDSGGQILSQGAQQKCDESFTPSASEFIAKTKFKLGRGISYPPGEGGSWNEFVDNEVDKIIAAEFGNFRLELKQYYPPLLRTDSSYELDSKYLIHGYYVKDGIAHEMDCWPVTSVMALGRKAGYAKRNEEITCDSKVAGTNGVIKFRVVHHEGPYFSYTTAAEKSAHPDWPKNILRAGKYCFDYVWAKLELKFKLTDEHGKYKEDYTWWIATKEEAEKYFSGSPNFSVIVKDTGGKRLPGIKVEVKSGDPSNAFSFSQVTGSEGIAGFLVPDGQYLSVTADGRPVYKAQTISGVLPSSLPGRTLEITLQKDTFTLNLVFSKDDFWWLYNAVMPAFLETPLPTTQISFPKDIEERVRELNRQPYNITPEKAKQLYQTAQKFFWIQEEKCNAATSTKATMKLTDQYKTMNKTDSRRTAQKDLSVPCYWVMVFEGLAYGKDYYSCTRYPTAEGEKIIEVKWHVGETGSFNQVG